MVVMGKVFIRVSMAVTILASVVGFATVSAAQIAQEPTDFSLQVSPSPLVTTLKPATETTLELKIRNAGTGAEELKIEPRRFSVSNDGEVRLDDTTPSEIAPWITFSSPRFTVRPGEWYTQKIRIALPKDTGFSYSFALIISRVKNEKPIEAGRLIKGSVAVFSLINVDRPGATRKLEVTDFSTSADIYEYVPAEIMVRFKNTGNTIVQPYGNIFVQRGSNDTKPLGTLPVNDAKGYILPGSERTLTAQWSDGFPLYKVAAKPDGGESRTETWDWSTLSQFRIGYYTAKLVAVYNDGQRDIPIEREVGFWILPWKIIVAVLVVLAVLVLGIWTIIRKFWSLFRRTKR